MSEASVLEENKMIFSLAGKVDDLFAAVMRQFNERQLRLFDLPAHRRVFLFILTRSCKTFSSVRTLCVRGYGQDVAPLLRSLLENLITVEYILRQPSFSDELTRRFVAYKWVILSRDLGDRSVFPVGAAGDPPATERARAEHILRKLAEFKKDFKILSDRALLTWSGRAVRDMAAAVSPLLRAEYDRTFRICSRFSHPGILGDQEYLIQDGHKLVFSPLPSGIGVALNMQHACRYSLRFLWICNAMFSFGREGALADIENELKALAARGFDSGSKVTGSVESAPGDIRESVVYFDI